MKTKEKLSNVIPFDSQDRNWLHTEKGRIIGCTTGPDAADNAEFIQTAWNEWDAIIKTLNELESDCNDLLGEWQSVDFCQLPTEAKMKEHNMCSLIRELLSKLKAKS